MITSSNHKSVELWLIAVCSFLLFVIIDYLLWHISQVQYIPRNMHTIFALLCFVVVIHWLIFPYPSGLLHWHCGNLTIAPVPAKQPRWIWINTSCEFIMNDCITTTKQSTTKPCAYLLGCTVEHGGWLDVIQPSQNRVKFYAIVNRNLRCDSLSLTSTSSILNISAPC